MKRAISLFCALLLMAVLSITALAEIDVDYAGRVDNFTGKPIDETATQVESERILIGGKTIYDRTRHIFVYSSGNQEVYSNVANDIATTEAVQLQLPEGMVYALYRDGIPVADVDVTYITQPGAYVLCESMSGDNKEVLRFTIISTVTGQLNTFRLPTGFLMSTTTLNGEEIEHEINSVSLSREGEYSINYRCPAAEMVFHSTFIVDHTPPTLALTEVVDGVAKRPVDISDLEPGASIGIWLNGKEMPYAEKLTGSGAYRIVVADEAGNRSDYQFTIQVYFNISAWILFLALLVLLALVGGYILYSRKHVRVR